MPRPVTERDRVARELFARLVDEKSRRVGLSRRDFAQSVMGSATALFVINQVYGCPSNNAPSDAGFDVDSTMMEDGAAACDALAGDEFVFDVQTHHVNPAGAWRETTGFESAAKLYPDVNFLVYHSGFELGVPEGAYDPNSTAGVDTLVKAAADNDIAPGNNVYAELGSTWRLIMGNPTTAAHVLGKLLVAFGEDNVLWGTDSIWYGSPQDQITAFRAFEIPESMQNDFGYPALTPGIKRKILGLNAAAVYDIDPAAKRCAIADDDIDKKKQAIVDDRALRKPSIKRMGPQTRREFLAYLKLHDGQPL